MKKRQRSAAAIAALIMLSTACGGVGDSLGENEEDGSAGSGTIDTMGFSLQDTIATTRVDRVKEEYPDLDVQVAEGGFDEQQFLSAVASGEPPSLVYLDRNDLGSYAARGALEPLDQCIEDEGIDMDAFRDAAVEQVTYDGQVYGIPEFTSVRVVMVDGDSPGLDDLSDWDAIEQYARQNTEKSGGELTKIGFDPKIPEFFPMWVEANGGSLYGEDGAPQLNSPEAVEALEFTAGLVNAQAPWSQFKAFRDTWDFFGGKNQFESNQLGAFPMEDWYVDVLGEVSPDVEMTTVPFETREGEPLTWATGLAWALPKGGSNQASACAFMRVMTEAETWVAAAEASKAERDKEGQAYIGTFTGNEEADEQIFSDVYEPTGNQALDQATQTIQDVQEAAFSFPASPASAETRKAYEDAVLRVLEGEQSAQEALDQAQTEAEKALERASE